MALQIAPIQCFLLQNLPLDLRFIICDILVLPLEKGQILVEIECDPNFQLQDPIVTLSQCCRSLMEEMGKWFRGKHMLRISPKYGVFNLERKIFCMRICDSEDRFESWSTSYQAFAKFCVEPAHSEVRHFRFMFDLFLDALNHGGKMMTYLKFGIEPKSVEVIYCERVCGLIVTYPFMALGRDCLIENCLFCNISDVEIVFRHVGEKEELVRVWEETPV